MTEQEQKELKVAKYLVGAAFFAMVFWVWDTLGISVFAIQTASPNLGSDEFQTRSFGLSLLGPVVATVAFVMSSAGQLVISLVIRVLASFYREPSTATASTAGLASASKVEATFKQMNERIKKLEATIKEWESS